MKTLDWGLLEARKILNTELLNKINIARFISEEEVKLLNRAVHLYEIEDKAKRFPNSIDNFYLTSSTLENGNVYLNIDVPKDYYIWDKKFTDHEKYHLEFNKAGNFNSIIKFNKTVPVVIVSTANSIRIKVDNATLLIRKHKDNTFNYAKFGFGKHKLKVKKDPEMKKVKVKSAKGIYTEQPSQEN